MILEWTVLELCKFKSIVSCKMCEKDYYEQLGANTSKME